MILFGIFPFSVIFLDFKGTKGHQFLMKPFKLTPKKTAKGWQVNIPPPLSESGKRQRLYFKSKDEAERHALPLRKGQRECTSEKLIPAAQSRFAARAFEMLGPRPPEELLHAVKLWLEKNDHAANSITFKEACENFCNSKSKAHLTGKYRLNFKHYPERFNILADKLLVEISTADLERELSRLPSVARNTAAAHLSSLWGFSIPKGWARVNPLDNVERAHTPKPKIPILEARDVRRLFVAAIRLYPDLVPLLAIETFAGIRPEESEKMRWDYIDFEDNVISVPDQVAKTRIGRHIEMHPTLVSWLDWHQEQGGRNTGKICPILPKRTKANPRKGKKALPINPEEHSPQALRSRLRKIRQRAKIIPWPQDVLRHTFASAALASEWRDIGKLCLELGHSSQKMLSRHYARSMRRKAGEAVFGVLPPRMKSNIISMRALA